LAVATEQVKSYVTGLAKDKQEKKALQHDPKWRKLHAETKRLQRQIVFIDKRNAKPAKAE
jgi:hypothetical protein